MDTDGTILSHEIESWDTTGYSYVWVEVPVIDGASTSDSIWMYYDNANVDDQHHSNDVWQSDDVAVLHLDESSIDSTAFGNNGSVSNVGLAAGISGGSGFFDGSTSSLNLGSDSTLDDIFAGGGTVSSCS